MLKDFLLTTLQKVQLYGNVRIHFRGVKLPEENEKYHHDFLYILTPEQWEASGGKVNAIIPVRASVIPKTADNCLIIAQTEPGNMINLVHECFRMYIEWYKDLYETIAIGGSLESLLDKCTPILRNPFFIDDSSYRTLARLRNYPTGNFKDNEYIFMQQNGHHSSEYIFAMLNSNVSVKSSEISPRAIVHKLNFLAHRTLYSTIKVDGEIVAFFTCIELETPITPGMVDVCETLTILLGKVLSNREYLPALRQNGLDGDLVLGVMNGTIVDCELTEKIFKQIGGKKDDYFIVYIHTNVNTSVNSFLLPRTTELLMSNFPNTFAFADGSRIIFFVNEPSGRELHDKIASSISFYLGDFDILIGFSLTFTDPGLLSVCFKQALAATKYGLLANSKGKVFGYSDVAAYDILDKYGEPKVLLATCHPAAFILHKHDQNNRMTLLPVVKAFIEYAGNTAKISEKLYMHRNTVYYRMRQAESLTGIDFTDGTSHFHLLLSIYIVEFTGTENPDE
ncbi:MAG: helix-turn-helix domain-containing protein [Clostridiales Family XIII bacterium]|nr:helix-turn-helix domain-containing protein [Clostridiales Family XIII bacterium]